VNQFLTDHQLVGNRLMTRESVETKTLANPLFRTMATFPSKGQQ
jgi:hypothetical protein